MCRATTPPALATPWACASPPSASCPATKPATDPASPTPPARLLAMTTTLLLQLSDPHIRDTSRPVVIAMHHPPFRTLIGHMDDIGLREGADALEAIVARHPQVERVICG